MSELLDAARTFIGAESETETAWDVVERGAVRRYAQAIMDEDPIFSDSCDNNARYGGPVAPALFPINLMRRPFGAPDPLQENADDPDFDGLGIAATNSLPEITPLAGTPFLNGGSEIEFFRYARHGETVTVKSRYADITEKQTSKGLMIFVIAESEFRNGDGDLLVRIRRTQIRRV